MSALESPAVLAARLQGSRDAFARIIADADTFARHGEESWMPSRAATLVAPDGSIVWDSTYLPDALAVAR